MSPVVDSFITSFSESKKIWTIGHKKEQATSHFKSRCLYGIGGTEYLHYQKV